MYPYGNSVRQRFNTEALIHCMTMIYRHSSPLLLLPNTVVSIDLSFKTSDDVTRHHTLAALVLFVFLTFAGMIVRYYLLTVKPEIFAYPLFREFRDLSKFVSRNFER